MRVFYLTPPAARGSALAAQTFVAEEIRAIRDFGVTPHVLTDELEKSVSVDGVTLHGVPRPGSRTAADLLRVCTRHALLTTRLMRRASHARQVVHALRIEHAALQVIRKERIDVVHSHFGWPAGLGGSLAARSTGTPLVASIRGTDVLTRADIGYGLRLDPVYAAALPHMFDTAAAILVATRFMEAAAREAGAPAGRVAVVDKGVDVDRFQRRSSPTVHKRQLDVAGPVILAVGGLQRRKGFETIIDALAVLGRADATLIICGSGPEQPALERHSGSRRVAGQVRFVGQVSRDRIPDYFSAADVFVHAAELEAAGNVILEAMACETPVVVTDSGGPAEYVEDGVNGFVVPVGDAFALAARVGTILDEPALAAGLGRAARTRVEQRHAYSRMMADIFTTYERVVHAHATQSAHHAVRSAIAHR